MAGSKSKAFTELMGGTQAVRPKPPEEKPMEIVPVREQVREVVLRSTQEAQMMSLFSGAMAEFGNSIKKAPLTDQKRYENSELRRALV